MSWKACWGQRGWVVEDAGMLRSLIVVELGTWAMVSVLRCLASHRRRLGNHGLPVSWIWFLLPVLLWQSRLSLESSFMSNGEMRLNGCIDRIVVA